MKKFSPGASTSGDYYYICDCCEIDDGRPALVWENLLSLADSGSHSHFALCMEI